MRFIKNHGGREKYFPTNLKKYRTNDCVIRAISIATEIDYLKVRDKNVLQMIATGNKILDKLEENGGLTDSQNDVMLVTGLYDKKKTN